MIRGVVVASDASALSLRLRVSAPVPAGIPEGETVVGVGPGDAALGYVGRPVRGRLTKGDSGWRLEKVWPADPVAERVVADVAAQLRRDTVARGRKAYRELGEYLPPFALYNQRGEVLQPAALRGKRVILNFIFTRCASPTMCPASTAKMAQLQKLVKEEGISNVELVSISFDPAYDTPGVLRFYADSYGIDGANFQFLTGPEETVRDLMRQFGVLTVQENGTINHTMATLLIDANGKILYRRDGSVWTPAEFIERLRKGEP